jgi:multidrug efflux pump subunit AcrA (membrane-fusion protein)
MKTTLTTVLALALMMGCTGKQESIHPVERGITQSVYASGVIVSTDQYQAYAMATGVIASLAVSEGDSVVRGQLLATIRNETASLANENALLAANYAAQRNNAERLDEARTAVTMAALKRADDSMMAQRQRNLMRQGVGSTVEVSQRELAAATSRANHESAQLRLAQLEKQLRFSARQADVQKSISGVAVRDLQVTSDVDGRVFSILRHVGETVNAQTPIAILGSDSYFRIELQVDEADIATIRPGQKAYITMDSYRGQVFEATITKVHPMMNSRTKAFIVEAHFVKGPEKLYANLTVEANIVLQTKDKALLVPREYVTKDGHVTLSEGSTRKVKLGIQDYQMVEILSGIGVADAIVKP